MISGRRIKRGKESCIKDPPGYNEGAAYIDQAQHESCRARDDATPYASNTPFIPKLYLKSLF